MDWSKAKTILIISLIVVNAILGIAIFNLNQGVETTVNEEFVEDSVRLLNNKEITVATEIPREMPSLKGLIVEYEILKTSELNNKFFDNNGKVSIKGEGLVEIQNEDEKLTILNEKHIIYESNRIDETLRINTDDDAIDYATDFLVDLEYDVTDMKLSYIKKSEQRYLLEFSKIYNEKYLESAFTNIQLDNGGIRKLERSWLNVIDVGDTPIYISSAPKSILALLSMNEVYGKTIQDISLSYYFDPAKHEYIQNPLEAKQGKAIPAWRIQFEDGYKVFIDDY
ncbi:MAG: two-component system regulatory protein YycI [Tissierellaceae bacterium]|nr:two-component system regulatory protein YycI [Tissierellaceae bacterium]